MGILIKAQLFFLVFIASMHTLTAMQSDSKQAVKAALAISQKTERVFLSELKEVLKHIVSLNTESHNAKLEIRKMSLEPIPQEDLQNAFSEEEKPMEAFVAKTKAEDKLNDADRAAIYLAHCLSMSSVWKLEDLDSTFIATYLESYLYMVRLFFTELQQSPEPRAVLEDRLLRFVQVFRWLIYDCDERDTVTKYYREIVEATPCQKDKAAKNIKESYPEFIGAMRALADKIRNT